MWVEYVENIEKNGYAEHPEKYFSFVKTAAMDRGKVKDAYEQVQALLSLI